VWRLIEAEVRGGKKEVVILSTLGSEKDCKTRLTHRLKLIRVEFCPLTEGFLPTKKEKYALDLTIWNKLINNKWMKKFFFKFPLDLHAFHEFWIRSFKYSVMKLASKSRNKELCNSKMVVSLFYDFLYRHLIDLLKNFFAIFGKLCFVVHCVRLFTIHLAAAI